MSWVHLHFEKILRETDKALQIRFESGEEHWIPLSQIADADDYSEGDTNGSISITEWIANEKGLGE